jgi:uroporphyrinogen decarboxylase
MKEAKDRSGTVVKGNLDPSSVLLWGTPELVLAKAKEVLEDAKAGGGLILSSGCDMAPATPFENIIAMVEASKRYGRYN